MMRKVTIGSFVRIAAIVTGLLAFGASSSPAAIWVGSFNVLRLGNNYPSGANQTNKKTEIRNVCAGNDVTILQEVMKTTEVANVTPGGQYYKVSALKGNTSYLEAYGFVYSAYANGGITDYTGTGFQRPPSAMRFWTGQSYVWVVNYHASFDATPNAAEIQKLNSVYTFYYNNAGTLDVVLAGDFNRTATSSYFNNLKNAGCSSIAPNVATSLNSSGAYANPYDHYAWNPAKTTVTNANRDDVNGLYWVQNVSDHAPVSAYVYY